jgi:hypothetical protein
MIRLLDGLIRSRKFNTLSSESKKTAYLHYFTKSRLYCIWQSIGSLRSKYSPRFNRDIKKIGNNHYYNSNCES